MKKFLCLIFCFVIVILVSNSFTPQMKAEAQSSGVYAKVLYNNVYFYSLPQESEENKLFILPKTYFVNLKTSKNEQFYYCQYKDIFGYVKKEAVSPMQGTPKQPFASASFRVFSLEGIGIFKRPNMSEEKLDIIPYLSEQLIYYGSLQGEEAIPGKSNQWYYAKYSKTSTIGFVYSVFCDQLSTINENTETFEIIHGPLFDSQPASEGLSNIAMTFIIIGVSLPCLIVLYLLVKPTMIKDKITNPKPKLQKHRRDYYEFDESDLN